MSVYKYNYQLRSFISNQFAYAGNRFFTCFCSSDGNAEALRTVLVPKMVNFTQIGLSKQLIETPSIVIPQQQLRTQGLRDVRLYRFWLQSGTERYTVDIPLGKNEQGLDSIVSALAQNCVDRGGHACEVVAYRAYGVDIVNSEV